MICILCRQSAKMQYSKCFQFVLFVSLLISYSLTDVEVGLSNQIFAALSTGKILGRILTTSKNKRGYIFQGIPYAQPPLGKLRYEKPVPPIPWQGILNCTDYKGACMSNSSRTTSPQSDISEDCLTVNVFMGVNCTEKIPCPVLLYMHGGNWNFDSPRMFPPETLVDNFASQGLVLVLVGYRLGSFGFWTTGTKDAPGNYGMYDVIESLHWIHKEISNLGGDPEKITIMGHSSAATGVSLLTLSPKAQTLFQQSVPMSGSGIQEDALEDTPEVNKEFAIRAGCATEAQWNSQDFSPILQCLRTKSGQELLLLQREMDDENKIFPGPRLDGPGGIFPASPPQLAKTRKPHRYMIGTVLKEFDLITLAVKNITENTVFQTCKNAAAKFGYKNIEKIATECVLTYKTSGLSLKQQMAALADDVGMFVPTFQDAASMRDSGGEVYLYSFNYVKRGWEAVAPFHSQDLTYVMGIHPFTFDSRDYQMGEIYPKLFSNFAKFATPTPNNDSNGAEIWQPLKPNGYNYYDINLPKPKNMPFYHSMGIRFWTVTAPFIENNSAENEQASNETEIISYSPQSVVITGTDWQTAFWITLVLGLVCLIGLFLLIGTQYCARKNFHKQYNAEMEDPEMQPAADENTPLISSSSNSNKNEKNYI